MAFCPATWGLVAAQGAIRFGSRSRRHRHIAMNAMSAHESLYSTGGRSPVARGEVICRCRG